MQVITLNTEDLEAHAARLAQMAEEGFRVHFDAIVGVRRGGAIVCDAFLRHFPKRRYAERYDMALQRPSTGHKVGWVRRLLKRLPYPLLDAMRMAESIFLSLKRKVIAPPPNQEVEIPEGLSTLLKIKAKPEILVIDDAIDSGDTLTAIAGTLRKTNPDANISVAVITETTDSPLIRADYTLYRNRTLIRFPWSNDYKNP